MSNAIESYGTLHYSPFLLAPLFEAFYETAAVQPNNLLLAYIVLPLTLPLNSRSFLKKSNSKSSLVTFSKDPSRLYGLAERVQELRELTNTCVQLTVDSGAIMIENDMSIRFLCRRLDTSACPKDAVKASEKLGRLLSPYDVPAVYRFLGVKQL